LAEAVIGHVNDLLNTCRLSAPVGEDGAEIRAADTLNEIAREALASGDQNVLDLVAGLSEMLGLGEEASA
jgi:hypothetical protein